ncbi:MAG: SDR family NAD(P)-dependent oxidoreductase [Actinobacteria bacterium]|nr:MAG: SDR family NAD(P)-dependent oxidoreductase [Actinomycetota bacterium]
MRELREKVAVITGAASGIGRAVAERCAGAGMKVVLADVEESALVAAERAFKDAGADVLGVRTDVSRADDVEALAGRAVERFGAVHLVHNNAGVAAGGLMWELPLADWKWVLGVNLWGVIHGVRTFVPLMLAQGDEGHVVNTASLAGLTSTPFLGPYSVSKHGVVTLSETLLKELAMQGAKVKVSVLCPGLVRTRIGESGRNRPAQLEHERDDDASAVDAMSSGAFQQLVEAGMDPAAVADQVLEAVRQERFWVLTHPELDQAIRSRADDILERRNPVAQSLMG